MAQKTNQNILKPWIIYLSSCLHIMFIMPAYNVWITKFEYHLIMKWYYPLGLCLRVCQNIITSFYKFAKPIYCTVCTCTVSKIRCSIHIHRGYNALMLQNDKLSWRLVYSCTFRFLHRQVLTEQSQNLGGKSYRRSNKGVLV